MSIKLGNGTLNKVYLGATEIKKSYLGSSLILDNTVSLDPMADFGNLISGWKADNIEGSHGDPITSWADAYGNNDLTSQNPALSTLEIINGIKEVNFSNIAFSAGQPSDLNFIAGTDDFSIVVQLGSRYVPGENAFVTWANGNSESFQYRFGLQASKWRTAIGGQNYTPSTQGAANDIFIMTYTAATDTLTLRKNDANWNTTLTTSPVNQTTYDLLIGGRQDAFDLLDANVRGIWMYNSVLTDINKDDIITYLNNNNANFTNLYTENDAAGTDINSTGNWPSTSKITITSVPSTDAGLGDDHVIRLETTDVSAGFGRVQLDYLTQGKEYIAVFRARNAQGDGGIFNWEGIANASYDISLSGTDWVEGTVTFTPNSPVVGIKVYPGFTSNTTGDAIEISSISIREKIASPDELYTLANAANPLNEVTNVSEGISLNSTVTAELINVKDGGSNYSLRFIDGGGGGFKNGQIRVPAANFTAGTNYIVKIRARANTGHSGDDAFFFAWSGITNTVNQGVPLDTYAEYEIPITSNGGELVMTCYPPGGVSTDYLEISSISIKEEIPDIPSSVDLPELISYYDENSIDTNAIVNGDNISIWNDLKGSSNAVQTTANEQPSLNLTADGTREIQFNGIDQFLNLGQPNALNFTPGTDTFTIMIQTGEIVANTGYLLCKGENNPDTRQYCIAINSTNDGFYTVVGGSERLTTIPFNLSTPSVIFFVVDTNVSFVRTNGIVNTAGGATTHDELSTNNFDTLIGARREVSNTGKTFLYNGSMRKLAFFNKVLSTQEMEAIEASI